MPHLQFRVYNRKQQKHYLLMMSSDYERSDWRDAIAGLMEKGHPELLIENIILLLQNAILCQCCVRVISHYRL